MLHSTWSNCSPKTWKPTWNQNIWKPLGGNVRTDPANLTCKMLNLEREKSPQEPRPSHRSPMWSPGWGSMALRSSLCQQRGGGMSHWARLAENNYPLLAGMFLAGGGAEGAHHGARHVLVLAHGGDGSMGVAGQQQPQLRLMEVAPMESKKHEAGALSPPHVMSCPGHNTKYIKQWWIYIF